MSRCTSFVCHERTTHLCSGGGNTTHFFVGVIFSTGPFGTSALSGMAAKAGAPAAAGGGDVTSPASAPNSPSSSSPDSFSEGSGVGSLRGTGEGEGLLRLGGLLLRGLYRNITISMHTLHGISCKED